VQHLRFDEVTDAGLGHHRNRDRADDALDHVRVAHPGHATLDADVGGYPLERHDGHRTGVLRDLRLIRGDDIHDHAALEHLGHAALDPGGSGHGRGATGGLFGHGETAPCTSLLAQEDLFSIVRAEPATLRWPISGSRPTVIAT